MTPRSSDPGRGLLIGLFVLGVGLLAAPAVFQMFSRAPAGGEMIDEFRPFMTRAEVTKLRGFLREIDAAATETHDQVDPAVAAQLGLDERAARERLTLLAHFETQWPAIDTDMNDMLDRMHANLGNFAGVDALPPFPLFPWFFVVPGLMVAAAAGLALRVAGQGRSPRRTLVVLAALGVGLIAAPAVFQMFSRAPGGGQMIDDFRPLMTRTKVTRIQGYFITIGNGEAELRNVALPASGIPSSLVPAVARFAKDWPTINAEMGPVVGVMADNLDNYAAVDALPPFPLFPWFFVAPGALIVVLAGIALKRRGRQADVRVTDLAVST
jgi:hypothetical protein